MQTQNPFLDEMAKLTTSAMGLAQAAGEEAKAAMRAQADRLAAEFDPDPAATTSTPSRPRSRPCAPRWRALRGAKAAKPQPLEAQGRRRKRPKRRLKIARQYTGESGLAWGKNPVTPRVAKQINFNVAGDSGAAVCSPPAAERGVVDGHHHTADDRSW